MSCLNKRLRDIPVTTKRFELDDKSLDIPSTLRALEHQHDRVSDVEQKARVFDTHLAPDINSIRTLSLTMLAAPFFLSKLYLVITWIQMEIFIGRREFGISQDHN